ncbi:MAG: FAD-dependent oxidoreductase [Clostridiales bacterium]|nr:FAD-dependent oxidoreductase [Clostridiales bacterium]
MNDFLLVGGGAHRTGENSAGGKYGNLRKTAQKFFPNGREVANWSAQDCMTLDGVPYIGQYSSSTPNLFVATGFGKWGMTTSMVSAMIISDLIQDKPHPYEIFSPQRFKPSVSAKSLMDEAAHAVKGLSSGIFNIPDAKLNDIPSGHGGLIEHDGQKVGVYKDESGEVFTVSARCTHLGCQLEWNPDELSWDCPCHGSRFDYHGDLIDNPAMENLHKN